MSTSPFSVETAATWAGAGTVFTVLLGLTVKFLMKTFRTDRLDATTTGAEINTYKRLQEEIIRLEAIIVAQQKRTDDLEARLDELRDIELDGQADLAVVTILLQQFPCGQNCKNTTASFDQLKDVVARMNERKKERQALIREVLHREPKSKAKAKTEKPKDDK